MKTLIKITLFIWTLCSISLHAKEETQVHYDVLFVGFDTGETNIFAQMFQHWEHKPQIGFLTLATSSKVAKDHNLSPLIDKVSCPPNNRLHNLSQQDLKQIKAIASAKIVITGMYSTPQRQIAELFKKEGSSVIGIWDNFSTFDRLPKDLMQNIEAFASSTDFIFTPSYEIAKDLNDRYHTDKALAMGQPTLEIWEQKLQAIDTSLLYGKTPFDQKKPIVTYMSGYEENGNNYNDSFILFAKSIENAGDDLQLLIQLHPRSDGSFEKDLLKEMSLKNSLFPTYFISDGRKDLSSFEAVALAQVVVSHRSTACIQALFAGKSILHVDVPGSAFTHFAIEKGLAQKLSDPLLIKRALLDASSKHRSSEACYEMGGIPPHGTQKMISFIENQLKANHGSAAKK